MQKISSFHQFILKIQQILESQEQKCQVYYDHHHPKIIKVIFGSLKFLSTHQKSVYFINSSMRYSQFQSPETTPNPIFFNQLLISINLYQHVKKQTFSSFCSRNVIDLQFDWLRAFWLISQEQDFPEKYGICARIQQLIQTFFIDQTQKKIMASFSNRFKKPYFGSKKTFFQKFGSVTHSPTWASNTMLSFKKITNEPIPRKLPDGRKDGRKGGQTLIHCNRLGSKK